MDNTASTIAAPAAAPAHHLLPKASEKLLAAEVVPVAEKSVTPAIEKTAPAPDKPEKEDRLHWANRMLKVAAYPIAAISGLWVTHTSIHAKFNQYARELKEFQVIEKKFAPLRQELATKCDMGIIDKVTNLTEGSKLRLANRHAIDVQMEKLGYDGVINKFRGLSRNKRQLAIVEGMTVAGIAIGALLTMANSKTLIEFFSGKEEKDQGQSR